MNINVYKGCRNSHAYGKLASQALMTNTTIHHCRFKSKTVEFCRLSLTQINDACEARKTRQPNFSYPRPAILDHATAGVIGNFHVLFPYSGSAFLHNLGRKWDFRRVT